MKYCTYITLYRGNKLPPFYIGYSTVEKVINKNYHGTVSSQKFKSSWQNELSTNPHLFTTKILSYHSTIKDAKSQETYLQKFFNVAKNPMYINEHVQGENFCCDRTGSTASVETKEKFRLARLGKSSGMKGKTLSDTHKAAISKALSGTTKNPDTVKKMADSRRGKKNEKKFSANSNKRRSETLKLKMTAEKRLAMSNAVKGENNPFFGKTHSPETIEKFKNVDRSYLKGLKWWTNGHSIVRAKDSPGEGWSPGRKLKSKL